MRIRLQQHNDMSDIKTALEKTSTMFDGNVKGTYELKTSLKDGRTDWLVRLSVHNSRGEGSAVSHSGRRTSSACWHVWGTFFENLPNGTVVYTRLKDAPFVTVGQDDLWNDYKVGSVYSYTYASQLCDCE